MENKTTDSKKEIKISELSPSEKLGNILLDSLEAHKRFMRICRMGADNPEELEILIPNERTSRRFKALSKVIAIQSEIALNSKPVVYQICFNNWKEKNKTSEEQKQNPFKKETNDYNTLLLFHKFLRYAEQEIIKSIRTKRFDDDFIWEKVDYKGETIFELTPNFFDMVEDLEESFEQIYSVLLRNGLLTTIITEQGKKLKSNEIF